VEISTRERGNTLPLRPGKDLNCSLDMTLVQDENRNLTFTDDTAIPNTYPGPQSQIDLDMDISSSFDDLIDMAGFEDHGAFQ